MRGSSLKAVWLCIISFLSSQAGTCRDSKFCSNNIERGEVQYHVKCKQWKQRCPCVCNDFDLKRATAQMNTNRKQLQRLGVFSGGSAQQAFGKKEGVRSQLVDEAHTVRSTAPSARPVPRKFPPIYKKVAPKVLPIVSNQSQCFLANNLEMPEITNVLYINLDESKERKIHMETMLTKMGLPHQRIAAIRPKNKMGSHLKLGEVGVWLGHQKVFSNSSSFQDTL